MELDRAKEFLREECGIEIASFFGIPIEKFDKEDLIRMVALSQKELDEERKRKIREMSFLRSLRQ